jgi:hypothetical protein
LTGEERRGRVGNKLTRLLRHVELSPAGIVVGSIIHGRYTDYRKLSLHGQMFILDGDLPKARSCYSEIIREDPGGWAAAYAYVDLAQIEDDPELAARYMELSCIASQGDPVPIKWCRDLAQATGSTELAAYYGKLYEEKSAENERKLTRVQPQ